MATKAPSIRKHLVWEFDLERFDFAKHASTVIERVIERGNLEEWREIVRFYGKNKILEVALNSPHLDAKHKNFTGIFLKSDLVNDTH